MKLLAHGSWQRTTKIEEGLNVGFVDGVIVSPQYEEPHATNELLENISRGYPHSIRLFDPLLYTCVVSGVERFNCGRLLKYNYCPDVLPTRSELQQEAVIEGLLRDSLEYQSQLDLTGLIAPNVLVRTSFDSKWGAVSDTFLRMTSEISDEYDKPIYASLVIEAEALSNRPQLFQFLTELTRFELECSGFYILVSLPEGETKDILTPTVLANWMYLVYSLSQNGYDVIVGYSDFLSPILGIAGASMGTSGWTGTTRRFSISRFLPSGGGLPNPRYSSPTLLNRILLTELVSELEPQLQSDPPFIKEVRKAPTNPLFQSLQHWSAVRNVVSWSTDDIEEGIKIARQKLRRATQVYAQLRRRVELDYKSGGELIETIEEGLSTFERLLDSDT
ncbi:MAG: hypothetical protein H6505_02700 [Calditrichaeota bacterium]|nr:hypothetical protein [Calditrichota bacterium]